MRASVPFSLRMPERPDEAVRWLVAAGKPPAVPMAGGTDLLLDVDSGRVSPGTIVSLRRLPWARLWFDGPALRVGSTLPLREIEQDPRVARGYPGLRAAVGAVGGTALRERATLGGNLARASPASDLIPALLAFDASVGIVGPSGHRTMSVHALVRGARETALRPGELIEAVRFPGPRPSAYLWQRVQPSHGISQVGVAVTRSPERRSWRIAIGGVLPRATRMPEAEEALSYAPTAVEVELAAQTASRVARFVTDKRASEAYRRRLVAILVRRAVAVVVRQARLGPRRGGPMARRLRSPARRAEPRRPRARPNTGGRGRR